ncbi:MAG: hypothetical protein UHL07_06490, partial [Bacteroidaceae bacterium]|nr:hypothetical protein [Bacteroidaceae bacterium]
YKLIRLHKKLFGHSLDRGESLSAELRLLQRLRNNETHFMIRQGNFLTEENFRVLHNFMVRFYKIMKTWWPIDGDDLELSIYLYWDWFNPDKGSGPCGFHYAPLQEFSYKVAVKNSKLAKDIAEALKGGYQYGAPDFSPYAIAVDLANGYNGLSAQFDEIWAMVHMMQSLGLIVVKDILDDEHGQIHYAMSVLL